MSGQCNVSILCSFGRHGDSFANALEMLALKRSKNTEVFEHTKKSFEEILKSKGINNVEDDSMTKQVVVSQE